MLTRKYMAEMRAELDGYGTAQPNPSSYLAPSIIRSGNPADSAENSRTAAGRLFPGRKIRLYSKPLHHLKVGYIKPNRSQQIKSLHIL